MRYEEMLDVLCTIQGDVNILLKEIRNRIAIDKETKTITVVYNMKPKAEDVLNVINKLYEVTPEQIYSGVRTSRICFFRQMAMYICHVHLDIGTLELATFFGRDVRSVNYSIDIMRYKINDNCPNALMHKRAIMKELALPKVS